MRNAQSGDAPSYITSVNRDFVLRSTARGEVKGGWKTKFQDNFDGAHGKPSGAVLSDTGQSGDLPDWLHQQTIYSEKSKHAETKTGWKTSFEKEFDDRFGKSSGAVLNDAAQSSDCPIWMQDQTPRAPRPPPVSHNPHYKTNVDASEFAGAAGMASGAILDDSAESSDAPYWMKRLPHVPRPKNNQRKSGWKTEFDDKQFEGAAGRSTGIALDDSAVSGGAPSWFHIDGVPRSKLQEKPQGHKTDFEVDFAPEQGRFGRRTNAILDDSAQSGDLPDYMHIPNVPLSKVQPKRQQRQITFDRTAAGLPAGSFPDDSAVSHDAPEFFHIDGVPQTEHHTHAGRQAHVGFGEYEKSHGMATSGFYDEGVSDTAVSAAAPDNFHIDGVPIVGGQEAVDKVQEHLRKLQELKPVRQIYDDSLKNERSKVGQRQGYGDMLKTAVSDDAPNFMLQNRFLSSVPPKPKMSLRKRFPEHDSDNIRPDMIMATKDEREKLFEMRTTKANESKSEEYKKTRFSEPIEGNTPKRFPLGKTRTKPPPPEAEHAMSQLIGSIPTNEQDATDLPLEMWNEQGNIRNEFAKKRALENRKRRMNAPGYYGFDHFDRAHHVPYRTPAKKTKRSALMVQRYAYATKAEADWHQDDDRKEGKIDEMARQL
eukprot:g1454.t1